MEKYVIICKEMQMRKKRVPKNGINGYNIHINNTNIHINDVCICANKNSGNECKRFL